MEHAQQQSIRQQPKWQIPFFTIWSGQQLSLIGSSAAQFALVWWLTKLTGSATVLATASMVALIPGVLLGPVVGALVDRWNRRTLMIVADGLVALAALWLVYLFWTDTVQIWHVYVIMLVRAVGGSFHQPAMQASTSLMVPKEHLSRVAGLNQAMHGALNIVAPPLGALLMEMLPLYSVMLVDVCTALLAIVPLFFVNVPQPARADRTGAPGTQEPSLWDDLLEGLRYVKGWPGLVVLIGFAMVFKIALTPAFSLLPLLVSQHFDGSAAQLSMLDSVAGIGFLLGGLILGVWGGFRRKIYTTLVGMVLFGLGFTVLGITPAGMFWLALAMVLVLGLTIPLIDGPIVAILQGTVAPEMQGRVFTLLGSLVNLTSPFSLAIAGPVTDWLGLQMWYVTAGVLCGAIGVAGFFLPAIVNIEHNNNGHVVEGVSPPVAAVAVPVDVTE